MFLWGFLEDVEKIPKKKLQVKLLSKKNNAEENAQNLKYFNSADTLEDQGDFEAAIESLDQITKNFEKYSLVKKRKKKN